MENLKLVWTQFSSIQWEATIRTSLPWDVGSSRMLLWSSVALFVAIALAAANAFGAFCGWIARMIVETGKPRQ